MSVPRLIGFTVSTTSARGGEFAGNYIKYYFIHKLTFQLTHQTDPFTDTPHHMPPPPPPQVRHQAVEDLHRLLQLPPLLRDCGRENYLHARRLVSRADHNGPGETNHAADRRS